MRNASEAQIESLKAEIERLRGELERRWTALGEEVTRAEAAEAKLAEAQDRQSDAEYALAAERTISFRMMGERDAERAKTVKLTDERDDFKAEALEIQESELRARKQWAAAEARTAKLVEAHKGRTVVGRASDGCETDWQECEVCRVNSPCPTLIHMRAAAKASEVKP